MTVRRLKQILDENPDNAEVNIGIRFRFDNRIVLTEIFRVTTVKIDGSVNLLIDDERLEKVTQEAA